MATTLPPIPLSAGYEETAPDLVIRSQMDTGPQKVRRRFTAGVRPISCRISCTLEQLQIFDAFYVGPAGGAVAWEWTHHVSHQTARFRFREPPKYAAVDNEALWWVTMSLEVLPPGMVA